jgi:hypothetical protein
MVIFLWILGILIFLNIIIIFFLSSTIRLKINTLNIKTKNNLDVDILSKVIYELDSFEKISSKEFFQVLKKYVIDIVYSFEVSFYFLGKIKIFSIEITNLYIKFAKKKIAISKFKNSKMYKFINKEDIKIEQKINLNEIRKLLPRILDFKFDFSVITENPKISYYLIIFLNVIISIFLVYLKTNDKKEDFKNWKYTITQSGTSLNSVNMLISCIIEWRIEHIIHIIKFLKKRSVIKNGNSSDRRINEKCYG